MFVAFEGIDGSGKSTQMALLSRALKSMGRSVHETREPSDRPIGKLIREGMSGRVSFDDRVIAALFVADRLDHLTNPFDGIIEKLADGLIVLTDRYVVSSYAYHPDFIDLDWIVSSNSISVDLLVPDLTIYLDLPPSIASDRLQRRGSADRYETLERLKSAHRAYDRAFETVERVMPMVRVDASRNEAETAKQVLEVFLEGMASQREV